MNDGPRLGWLAFAALVVIAAPVSSTPFAVITGLFGTPDIVTSNSNYLSGVLALAGSLIRNNVDAARVLLTTREIWEAVPPEFKEKLERTWDPEFVDNVYCNIDEEALDTIYPVDHAQRLRESFPVTCTKLHAFRLVQYSKALYLDSDTIVVGDINPLFRLHAEFAAAADPCTQYIFNSGVLLFRPNMTTFETLMEFARHSSSFDAGDQGILNVFFGTRWQMAAVADTAAVTKLAQAYNAPPTLGLTWDGLGRVLGTTLVRDHGLPEGILMENRIIHFMGVREKPWIVMQKFLRLMHQDLSQAWATLEGVRNKEVYIAWVDSYARALSYTPPSKGGPRGDSGSRDSRDEL